MADQELGAEGDVEPHLRTELVRELNAAIRRAAERLGVHQDSMLELYCECGCWAIVQLTVARYDERHGQPLYREGHPR
jgi:hypothetical protein